MLAPNPGTAYIRPMANIDHVPQNAAPGPEPARKISFVSLGCPKALVDSERIITRLRAEGYELARKHDGADLVIVNTCGFLDSAQAESLEAIGSARSEEHTSEPQSRLQLVCRLLLEKKKNIQMQLDFSSTLTGEAREAGREEPE